MNLNIVKLLIISIFFVSGNSFASKRTCFCSQQIVKGTKILKAGLNKRTFNKGSKTFCRKKDKKNCAKSCNNTSKVTKVLKDSTSLQKEKKKKCKALIETLHKESSSIAKRSKAFEWKKVSWGFSIVKKAIEIYENEKCSSL